jgi:hypothetical protein
LENLKKIKFSEEEDLKKTYRNSDKQEKQMKMLKKEMKFFKN